MSQPENNLSLLQALGRTFNDFAASTSLHGFTFLTVRGERPLIERCFWWIIEILAICGVLRVTVFTWNEFMDEPTVISLENTSYPITKIPFPGISVCNVNKISLERARDYAKFLAQKTNVAETKLLHLMKNFGKMHDSETVSTDDDLEMFQTLLDTYDVDNETGNFDLYNTLKKLAVPCEELLSDCFWNGQKYDCQDLFIFESTMEGFCCIFNYVSPFGLHGITPIIESNNFTPLYPTRHDRHGGLTVTVKSNVSDYFYPTLSFIGVNLQIFNPDDFPDETSGNFQEKVIEAGVEMFVRLYGISTQAVPEVKRYSLAKRKCKFREEARTIIGTKYSFSDCILDCRIKSMIALCQCVPFLFIKSIIGPPQAQCTIVDIPCLIRFKDKWGRLNPYDFDGIDELDREKQDSLLCQDCLPSCTGFMYSVKNDFAYLREQWSDYSIINIFFDSPYATLYKHDVIWYWFEIVGTFGGTCGLVIGLSTIGIIEFVYYFTVILFRYLF